MFTILLRVFVVYVIVLFFLRLMGKRQVGELQPFELVLTLIMADLATLPMTQNSVPLIFSLVPLSFLVVVHFVVSLLSRKSLFVRKLVNGRPVVVISPKGVEFDALKSLNMTFDDLSQGLRAMNVFNFEDVAYAIVETNGSLSVILKSQVSPVCNQSLNISLPPASLPLVLVSAGKLVKKNLQITKVEKSFFEDVFKKIGVKSEKDVVLLTLNANGNVFVQPKDQKCQTLQTDFRGDGKW